MIEPNVLQPNLVPITLEDLNIQEGMDVEGTPVANTPTPPPADLNIQVSSNGSIMSIGNLQSTNFHAGVSGWRLDSNGNIEANDGNFRGDISGATGTFTGSVTTSAIIATGGTIGGWTINATSIFTGTEDHSGYTANAGDLTIYSNGTVASIHGKEFYIGTDGKLTCTSITATGTINAQAGYLASGVYVDTVNGLLCESGGINVGVAGHVRGGATDYFTGTGFWLGYDTDKYKLSIGDPDGKYLAWDGTKFVVNGFVMDGKGAFGGDGADGALTITTGTTTIDCDGARVVVKNYSSISITGDGDLAFSNPHADGTYIVLKSQGNVTIDSTATPNIDVSELGSTGAGGGDISKCDVGTISVSTLVNTNPQERFSIFFITSKSGLKPLLVGANGGTGTKGYQATRDAGVGGRGGGSLMIECNGALDFQGTITATGEVGGAYGGGTTGWGSGGGGGGGGGTVGILYNTLTDETGTITCAGGAGSAGTGAGGGAGGTALENAGGNGFGGAGGDRVNSPDGGLGGGGGQGCGGDNGVKGSTANGSGGGGGGGGAWFVERNDSFA